MKTLYSKCLRFRPSQKPQNPIRDTLSGIETKDLYRARLPLQLAKTPKPYQGLKHLTILQEHIFYQTRKNPKTLSGIETRILYSETEQTTPLAKTPKPYQGLKRAVAVRLCGFHTLLAKTPKPYQGLKKAISDEAVAITSPKRGYLGMPA